MRGWINVDFGDLDAAKSDFAAALQLNPDSHSLQYALGYVAWKRREYRDALARYDKAEPNYLSVGYFYYERGYANYMLDQDRSALRDADRALEIDPGDYDAMWLKGAALLYLNDFPAARSVLNKAARLAPDNAEILIMRGRVSIAAEHYLAAVGDFSKALELNPDSQAAEIYRAYATGMAGGTTLARSTFKDILARQPDTALANELMARLLFKMGDYADAAVYSGRLLELAPGYSSYQVLHADILLELGAYADAAENYRTAVSRSEEPPANWLRMAAYSAHKAEDTDNALYYLRLAGRADPTDVWTQGMLGDLLLARSEFDKARVAYQHALDYMSDENEKDDFRLNIAKTLAGGGALAEALDIIAQLSGRHPDRADMVWTRANLLFDLKRLDDALAEFEHYRRLEPSSLKVHYRLVDVLTALERHRQAVETADTIVYLEEDKAAGYLARGKLYLELEEFEAAARDFGRAVDLHPEQGGLKLMQARALIGLGEPARALAVLDTVADPDSDQSDLLDLRVRAQEMLGRKDAAARPVEAAKATEDGADSPHTVDLGGHLR